jgi:UDP-N-acetylmuramyl pentapeptide synthase
VIVQQLGQLVRASKLLGSAAISAAVSGAFAFMCFLAALAAALERGLTPMSR